jgi:hypothetical protein
MSALRQTIRHGSMLFGSAVLAAAFSLALWKWFPYADFHRTTLEDRFFLWEAVVWLLGLLLIFFGIGAALGTLHLANARMPPMEEVYWSSRTRPRSQERVSIFGVWMVLTGGVLLALAAWARASLLP